jgi:hypothetical protein
VRVICETRKNVQHFLMGESVELACSGAFARQGKWEQRPARFTAARSVAVNDQHKLTQGVDH